MKISASATRPKSGGEIRCASTAVETKVMSRTPTRDPYDHTMPRKMRAASPGVRSAVMAVGREAYPCHTGAASDCAEA